MPTQASDNIAAGAANWREQLRINSRRTIYVAIIFVVLYVAVGLLIDLFIHGSGYFSAVGVGPNVYQQAPSLGEIFKGLITFQIMPWATLVMLVIAVFSLFLTYSFYDKMMLMGTEYVEVTAESKSLEERQIYNVVEEMKVAAGMRYMPRVFIINADYMNAFASGYSERSAMVAITRGLMSKLTRAELQAVMAHELSHIRHGDIRLTLTASVLANLMIMAMDILFYGVLFGGSGRDREDSRGANILFVIVALVRFLLPIVTIVLMLYLSRTREYMADAGSVELTRSNEPMISALLKIHNDHQQNAEAYSQAYNSTAHESVRRESYIYDPVKMGVEAKRAPSDFFSTHPGLKKRLAALGFKGFRS